jgi:hypothetical protein
MKHMGGLGLIDSGFSGKANTAVDNADCTFVIITMTV